MPNWSEGVLKIRGTKEKILKFAKECFSGTNGWKIENIDENAGEYSLGKNENFKIDVDEYGNIIIQDTQDTHIKGTRRMFINQDSIDWYFDDRFKTHIVTVNVQQAWYVDAEQLKKLSKEYGVDFKIYAFEKGMEFNQDIEVVEAEIIKNEGIEFEEYSWECINPELGG